MLTLRLQRTGRKKLAQYRLVAQEHSVSPTSGKVAEQLGSYDPHTKEAKLNVEAIEKHLSNGAQPSNRVAKLLKAEGVKLPKWVTIKTKEPKKAEPEETSGEAKEASEPKPEEAKTDATPEAVPAEDKPKSDKDKEAEA